MSVEDENQGQEESTNDEQTLDLGPALDRLSSGLFPIWERRPWRQGWRVLAFMSP